MLLKLSTQVSTPYIELNRDHHTPKIDDYVMEVMIVQGPGRKLRALANKFISRKGVRTGKMTMASQIMPPIHPLPQSRLEEETPENPYAPPV